jgi:hypothetical protein
VPHSPVLRVRVLTWALAHRSTLSLQRDPLQLLNASFPVSLNYITPANPFQSLDFRVPRSNDLKMVLIP